MDSPSLHAAVFRALRWKADPNRAAKLALLQAAVQKKQLEVAIGAAELLKKVFPGHVLDGIELPNRDSDEMFRSANDAQAA